MQETKRSKQDEAISEREAEATTDETLTDLEEQQKVGETSDLGEIPAPDSEPNQSRQGRNDDDLM